MITKIPLSFILIIFSVLTISFSGVGKELNEEFDLVFNHVATQVMATDINRAFEIADSLLENSQDGYQEVKSLMLLATLYEFKGELSNSVLHAEKAFKKAEKSKLHEWEARIVGYLASHYNNLEMYDEGLIYLNKANEFIPKIENDNVKYMFEAFLLQEKGRFYIAKDLPKDALSLVEEALKSLEKISDGENKTLFIIDNYILAGQILLRLEEWSKAQVVFEKAKTLRDKESIKDDFSVIHIFLGLSATSLNMQNYEETITFLDKAREILETSNSLFLQADLYEGYKNYYKKIGDYENYTLFNDRYLKLLNQKEKEKDTAIQKYLEDTAEYKSSQMGNNDILIVVSISLLMSIGLIVFYYRKKTKRTKKQFAKTLSKLEDIYTKTGQLNLETQSKPTNNEYSSQMSEEIKDKIVLKLIEFEQGDEFLNQNTTLSTLAEYVDTNQKYLSYVLNNEKQKNFNTYINDLRIYYVMEKLKKDPQYRNYKINELAEKCGFSSHSKFSSAFKIVTGESPSEYLSGLNKEI